MAIRIFTVSAAEISVDEGEQLCAECAAACARLTGVTAHLWTVNPRTRMISGIVKWTESEMIAMGTESLCRVVATLHPAHIAPACRSLTCPTRRAAETTPNTGFVHYPPDYDPRG
jgi:hypothetical protein